MYRILIYSLLLFALVACQSDKKGQQSTTNEIAKPAPVSAVEEPTEAENAIKFDIDPNISIQEKKGDSDFSEKSVYLPEKANLRPNIAPKAFAYADLKSKSFKAMGNEPFWNIEIKGDELTFHQMGFEKKAYSLSSAEAKSDRLIYTVASGKSAIQLELTKQKCEDDMSGKAFAYAVILNKDGKQFKGCAKEIFK